MSDSWPFVYQTDKPINIFIARDICSLMITLKPTLQPKVMWNTSSIQQRLMCLSVLQHVKGLWLKTMVLGKLSCSRLGYREWESTPATNADLSWVSIPRESIWSGGVSQVHLKVEITQTLKNTGQTWSCVGSGGSVSTWLQYRGFGFSSRYWVMLFGLRCKKQFSVSYGAEPCFQLRSSRLEEWWRQPAFWLNRDPLSQSKSSGTGQAFVGLFGTDFTETDLLHSQV